MGVVAFADSAGTFSSARYGQQPAGSYVSAQLGEAQGHFLEALQGHFAQPLHLDLVARAVRSPAPLPKLETA
jgi:hypothetical protein